MGTTCGRSSVHSTSHQSQIEVLGTHFNIEAYEKDDKVLATLVEGKIGFILSLIHISLRISQYMIEYGEISGEANAHGLRAGTNLICIEICFRFAGDTLSLIHI